MHRMGGERRRPTGGVVVLALPVAAWVGGLVWLAASLREDAKPDAVAPSMRASAETTSSATTVLDALPETGETARAPGIVLPVGRAPEPAAGPPGGPRAALSGIVVDPNGHALAGAQVRLERRSSISAAQGAVPAPVATDEAGAFAFAELARGRWSVAACGSGFAPSEPLELDLAEAETRADLQIVVRPPARLHGRVLDDEGRREAGRAVQILAYLPTCGPRDVLRTTDEQGRFEFDALPPGRFGVQRKLGGGDALHWADSPETLRAARNARASVWVDLAEGGEAEVVLGGRAQLAIRLWGHVQGADRSRGPLFVNAWPTTVDKRSTRIFGLVGADGTYAIELEEAGDYVLTLDTQIGSHASKRATIPAEPSVRVDFELGACALLGRVVDEHGKPVAYARVRPLRVRGPDASESPSSARQISATTAADGTFAIECLEPGTYDLGVVAGHSANVDARVPRIEGLVLEPGQRLAGLELRFRPTGLLEVRVEGPRGPEGGASVDVVDERGRPVRLSTSSDGLAGVRLLPGHYTARARRNELSSEWSGTLAVEPGARVEARLVLVPRGELRVEVRDAGEGSLVVRAVDERGRELALDTLGSGMRVEPGSDGSGGAVRVARLAALPPGRAVVSAKESSGRTASVTVDVGGAGEQQVVLQLRN
jgi:protocatechuate 3,4-dioxygenase beta subunit